jgi:amino acid adenylation domain-containing protein
MLDARQPVPARPSQAIQLLPPLATEPVGASEPDAVAPLLPAQRRIWLLQRLFPNGAAHVMPVVLRFEGRLDEASLQRALDALVARHLALRTTIEQQDGNPIQRVRRANGIHLERPRLRRKLTGRDEEGSLAALRMIVDEAIRTPFDLEHGPLVRAHLIKRAPRSHVLALIVHGVVCDDDSRRTLIRDLVDLYRAFAAGRPDPLPALPVTPQDIATTRAHADGATATEDLNWWRETLADLETLQLPPDRAAPPLPSQRSDRHVVAIPAEVVAPLRALGAAEDASLLMTTLAAFAALLARAAGSDDIAIGTPFSTRSEAAAGVVGQLTNTLVLRLDLSDDPSFRESIRRARRVALDAFAHGETPFEAIVDALKPDRSLQRTPLAPVTLAVHDPALERGACPHLAASVLDVDSGACLDDIRLDLEPEGDALIARWRFSRDLFAPATIARMANQFAILLRAAVADPDRPLADISLLTEAERRLILDVWNPPASVAPLPSLPEAFRRRASAHPDAPALFFEDEAISYGALAARSATLAQELRRRGIGPGMTVGICLKRTPSLPVALLATLRAGAVCLPLDPAYPPARLAFMVDDAGAALILTDALGDAALPAGAEPRLRCDAPAAPDGSDADEPPAIEIADHDPALLVYTSGSTGAPKGVAVTHRGAANLCHWIGQAYPFAPDDICAFIASASFVDMVWDLFGPLLNGAPAVIVPEAVRKNPERLIDLLAARGVTRLLAPPSLLRAMLDAEADLAVRLPNLRLLFSTAETLGPDLAERLAERMPHARLVNTYGSSETTAVVTTAEVAPGAGQTRVPIGRPIANSRVYVLDPRGRLGPVGTRGEIAVGGAAVAAGYHRRSDLTAERFVPDPFAADPAARLFRTGDRGRWREDGSLEWLGRGDRLVKIRGFRVEPGEVEAALAQHPALREAAVVPRADGRDVCLVAYVVPHAAPAPAAGELRSFLRDRVPEFMIPAQFVAFDALPRTPTGKLDRRALPATAGLDRSSTCRAPSTPTEAALTSIWEQLLAARPIGVDDNFFDLGGQSLLVVRTVAAIRAALGVDLPARALFETPTIAALAARIDAMNREAPADDAPHDAAITPLNAGAEGGGIFLVPGGAGEAFNLVPFAKLFRRAAPNRPAWGFIGRERYDGAGTAHDWVRDIAARYVREMRARQPDGPYLVVGACAGGNVAFEMAQQLHAAGAEVARLILMDVWHSGGRSIRRVGVPSFEEKRPDAQRLQERLAIRGLGAAYRDDEETSALRAASREIMERRFWLNQYVAGPYPLPITLLVNEAWHAENATLGWHAVAAGGLEVIVMAGEHDDYLDGHLDETVAHVRALLDAIDAGRT